MNAIHDAQRLLHHMFEVEMGFMQSPGADVASLGRAFHPDVVIHQPASLPYGGDWRGLSGAGALFRRMGAIWADMAVEGMEATMQGDTVFMTCRLRLVARAGGRAAVQPFAQLLRFRDGLLVDGTPFYHDTAALLGLLAGD